MLKVCQTTVIDNRLLLPDSHDSQYYEYNEYYSVLQQVMKINQSSVMGDVSFRENLHFSNPYHMFNTIGSSRTLADTGPSVLVRDICNCSRVQPSERIIPIQVEGRQLSSPHQYIDLTDNAENTNNNGYGQDAGKPRQRRSPPSSHSNRQHPRHTSEARTSAQEWRSPRDVRLEASPLRVKDSEVNLCEDLIDMCMYEDLFNSQEAYASRSLNDSRHASVSGHDATRTNSKSDSLVVEQRKSMMRNTSPTITPTPSYPVYRHLKRQLHKDGHQVDYIRGDGNCFFRALSKEVYGTEEFHEDVRQAVMDLMEKYPREFEQFMDTGTSVSKHVTDMRRASTWASSAEIYAAATLLQRDIYVLSPDHTGNNYNWMLFKVMFTYTSDMSYHPCFIMMCHTHGNHYDRITPENRTCNCDCEPPCLSGVQAYVDLTIPDSEMATENA